MRGFFRLFLFSFFFLDNESGYSNPLRYNCCNFVAERLQTGINVDFFKRDYEFYLFQVQKKEKLNEKMDESITN